MDLEVEMWLLIRVVHYSGGVGEEIGSGGGWGLCVSVNLDLKAA